MAPTAPLRSWRPRTLRSLPSDDNTARDRAASHVGMRIAGSPADSADEMAGWLAHRGLQP